MQVHEKRRKVAKYCVFPMIWGSGGSKSRLAKAAGAEPCGQIRDETLHAVVARSAFQVKMHNAHQRRTTFGSCDVEKVYAVVARRTFRSQNVQHTSCSDYFWKLRCAQSTFRSQNEKKTACRTTFGCRLAWQVQGIVHLVKSEQNVRVL